MFPHPVMAPCFVYFQNKFNKAKNKIFFVNMKMKRIIHLSLFSALKKDKMKKDTNTWDSLDEEISAAEEKKHGIKNFIKRRLRSRSSMIRRAKKDGSSDLSPNNTLEKQNQPGQSDKPSTKGTHSLPRKTEVKSQT